jgi:hypothetical protein
MVFELSTEHQKHFVRAVHGRARQRKRVLSYALLFDYSKDFLLLLVNRCLNCFHG